MSSPLPKHGLVALLVVALVLVSTEPAMAGLFQIPNLGFFNFLAPVIRGFSLLVLRLIFFIPGGENFLIDLI